MVTGPVSGPGVPRTRPALDELGQLLLTGENVSEHDQHNATVYWRTIWWQALWQESVDDPPTLLLHGDADHLVPIQQSQLLLEKLKAVNVPAELAAKAVCVAAIG